MTVINNIFSRLPQEIQEFMVAVQVRLPDSSRIHLVGGAVRDLTFHVLHPLSARPEGRDYDFVVTGMDLDQLEPLLQLPLLSVKRAGVHKPMLLVRFPWGVEVEVGALIGSLNEDLAARDFRINAMAYSPLDGFTDPFDGMADISARVLDLMPGSPFSDDPARLIRAARFLGRFDLTPSDRLVTEAQALAPKVRSLPGARLGLELTRLLLSDGWVKGLRFLSETGVLGALIPEWNRARDLDQDSPYHSETVGDHILSVCAELSPTRSLVLRLAALLHDIGKPQTKQIVIKGGAARGTFYGHDLAGAQIVRDTLPFLGFSQALVADVATLVERHMSLRHDLSEAKLRALAHTLGPALVPLFAELVRSDRAVHVGGVTPAYASRIEALELAFTALPASASGRFSDHDLALSGVDIAALGVSVRGIGEVKRHLVGLVVAGEVTNERSELLAQAQEFVSARSGSGLQG